MILKVIPYYKRFQCDFSYLWHVARSLCICLNVSYSQNHPQPLWSVLWMRFWWLRREIFIYKMITVKALERPSNRCKQRLATTFQSRENGVLKIATRTRLSISNAHAVSKVTLFSWKRAHFSVLHLVVPHFPFLQRAYVWGTQLPSPLNVA